MNKKEFTLYDKIINYLMIKPVGGIKLIKYSCIKSCAYC